MNFHTNYLFFLQVDIVLPEDMSLREAHDIGEDLQKKIERIPEVERVFLINFISFSKLKIITKFRHLCILIMNITIKLVMNTKLFKNSSQSFKNILINPEFSSSFYTCLSVM